MTILTTDATYGMTSREQLAPAGIPFIATTGPQKIARISADISYELLIHFQGSGDAVTIDLSNGSASGAVTAVAATGTITFAGLPVADEFITVNGTVYTFKAAAGTATEITIGADADETAANTAAAIDFNEAAIGAAASTNAVTLTAEDAGELGNAYTLAESATNVTVSGATFAGGVDAVTITGAGVDYEGNALATATKVTGLLIVPTAGAATLTLGSELDGSVAAPGGLQVWSAAGNAAWVDDLVLASTAPGTTLQVAVRALE